MVLVTQIIDSHLSILIVAHASSPFVQILQSYLKKYTHNLFFSSIIPKNLKKFDYCFFLDEKQVLYKSPQFTSSKIILIYFDMSEKLQQLAQKTSTQGIDNIKIIDMTSVAVNDSTFDKILWFAFSKTKETFLKLSHIPKIKNTRSNLSFFKTGTKKIITKKGVVIAGIILMLSSLFAFIAPLFFSTYFYYKSGVLLNDEHYLESESYLDGGKKYYSWAKALYQPVRSVWLLFSLALPVDTIFDTADRAKNILEQGQILYKNGSAMFALILNKNKSSQDRSELSLRLTRIRTALKVIDENSVSLNEKIPDNFFSFHKLKMHLSDLIALNSKLIKFFDETDLIFAKDSPKTYLLLFANNKELRPGGGFIGSFGTLTFRDYTLEKMQIYDVYDADGQLIAHVDPPDAIRKYLHQPHWFLRDSAFSPDFLDNYIQAKYFLEKEMGMKDLAGALLITTSTLENILQSYEEVYLSDYNEKVNAQNFYLKAQVYAEKNFFPGSIQKKSFLSSLTRQLLINADSVSIKKLALNVKKSLDEKQLVAYFDDPKLQELFDSSYWSGRVLQPTCSKNIAVNCISDFIFPVDANLGVNKANFFISRLANLRLRIAPDGLVNHTFTIEYKNEAPSEIFPGGTYSNYFQLLLPAQTQIKSASINDVAVGEIDEKNEQYKTIGFFLSIPPKKTTEIRIDYVIKNTIQKGSSTYQLILQKQIGSSNNDFTLELSLPSSIKLVSENFSPLVKDNRILYNTSVSQDKIFFLDLVRE